MANPPVTGIITGGTPYVPPTEPAQDLSGLDNPEPGTLLLCGAGLAAVVYARRKRGNGAQSA